MLLLLFERKQAHGADSDGDVDAVATADCYMISDCYSVLRLRENFR